MKIEFEVPEWAIGKHIHIFAGAELLGNKEAKVVHQNGKHITIYSPLKIKQENGRCNGCGACCEDGIDERLIEMMIKAINKKRKFSGKSCTFLGDDGCILRAWIPFSCIRSVCTVWNGCTEKLEVVD